MQNKKFNELTGLYNKKKLQLIRKTDIKLLQIMVETSYELGDLILKNADKVGTIQYNRWKQIKKNIDHIVKQSSLQIGENIKNSIKSSIEVSNELQLKQIPVLETLYNVKGLTPYTVPSVKAAANSIKKIWEDGYKFSDRIWRFNKLQRNKFEQIVFSGITRGQSAVNMAKELQTKDFILSKGPNWTTAVKRQKFTHNHIKDLLQAQDKTTKQMAEFVGKSSSWGNNLIKGKTAPSDKTMDSLGRFFGVTKNQIYGYKMGSVSYNALRLSRTEIMSAYSSAYMESAKNNPWNMGVVFHLALERNCPICEGHDAHGFFTLEEAPQLPIHPNCGCYYSEELPSLKEMEQILKAA